MGSRRNSKKFVAIPPRLLKYDHRRSPAFGRRRLRDIALPRLRGQTESAHADAVEFAQSFPGVSVADGRRPAPTSPETNDLPQGTFIYKAEDSIGQVYFPHTGVISLIVGLTSGQFVEAGMLGRNGVIGAGAPLDGAIALNSAIAQVESSGTW